MVFCGNFPSRHRIKCNCPLKTSEVSDYKCSNDSSLFHYGRTAYTTYTKTPSDLRLFSKISCDLDLFKTKMASRTCCERINNRIFHNYCLENSKVRDNKALSFGQQFVLLIFIWVLDLNVLILGFYLY